MKKVVLAMCVTVLMVCGTTFGEVIFEHVGDVDPQTEGFSVDSGGSGWSVGPVDDGGVAAWRVSDEEDRSQIAYQFPLSDDDRIAMLEGWTLSARLRITTGPNDPVDNAIMFQTRANGRWWRLDFGTDEQNNPLVGLFVPSSPPSEILSGVVQGDGYHTYEIVNEGDPNICKILVDGVTVFTDWTAGPTSRTSAAFGSNNSGNTGLGSANYEFVRLIPEPATIALLAMAVPALLRSRRRA